MRARTINLPTRLVLISLAITAVAFITILLVAQTKSVPIAISNNTTVWASVSDTEQKQLEGKVTAVAIYMSSMSQACLGNPFLKTALRDHLNKEFLGIPFTKDKSYKESLKQLETQCGKTSKVFADIDKLLESVGDIIKKLGTEGVDWIVTMLLG